MKLKLNNLKVNSFETTIQEDTTKTILGGTGTTCHVGPTVFGCTISGNFFKVFGNCRFCPTGGNCNTELCNDGG